MRGEKKNFSIVKTFFTFDYESVRREQSEKDRENVRDKETIKFNVYCNL